MTDRLPDDSASVDPDLTRAQPSGIKAAEAIGPYRLLERVGEGGMGEVWLAEQTEPVRRQVALKVIKPGMDTAQVVARFEAERQALALMDHPAHRPGLRRRRHAAGPPVLRHGAACSGVPITDVLRRGTR